MRLAPATTWTCKQPTRLGLEHPPDAPPDPDILNFRRVEFVRDLMVEFGLRNKPVWFNEYGWNASPADMNPAKLVWRRVSEETQAEWTVEGVRYALAQWPWAGVFNLWFFRKPLGALTPDESEYYFRMVEPGLHPAAGLPSCAARRHRHLVRLGPT